MSGTPNTAATEPAQAPASEETPVYAKTRHGNNLWLITYDEGWRSGVLCSDMYEADADFLLSVLGRTPRGAR